MNGFERRRNQKKKQILDAARELLFSRGAQKVTVREIAEKAHVSPVSIYNFFESKENLFRQAFFAYMDQAMEQLMALVNSDMPVRAKIGKLYKISGEMAGEISEEAYASYPQDDPLTQKFKEEYAVKKAVPAMTRLVEQAKASGAIPAHISAQAVMLYMQAFGHILDSPPLKSGYNADLRSQIGYLFYYGLFGKP